MFLGVAKKCGLLIHPHHGLMDAACETIALNLNEPPDTWDWAVGEPHQVATWFNGTTSPHLPEIFLQHPGFPQQSQGNAHTGGGQGRARGHAHGEEGLLVGHGQQRARHQR